MSLISASPHVFHIYVAADFTLREDDVRRNLFARGNRFACHSPAGHVRRVDPGKTMEFLRLGAAWQDDGLLRSWSCATVRWGSYVELADASRHAIWTAPSHVQGLASPWRRAAPGAERYYPREGLG